MATPAAASRPWECPGCGKLYRLVPGKKAPLLCPVCRTARGSVTAEASAFDQLSAAVQAEKERDPLAIRAARPTAAEPTAVQFEPSPFERLFTAVDSGETEDLKKSRPAPGSVETSLETPEPAIVRTPRRQTTGQRRVVVVVGAASLLLAGWGLYGILSQAPGGTPGEAEVWKKAKAAVAEHLLAPKTAEFPKPGEIRRVRDSENPRWSVKSVVDASNEHGVPLRHHWRLEMAFDRQTRQWETAWIEIDDERVYSRLAPELADHDSTAYGEPGKKGRAPAIARDERQDHAPTAADRETMERRISNQDDAGEAESELDREARRERGQWREVAVFEGLKKHETARFKVGRGGWRYRWKCDGDATVRLYDAAGKPVGDEIEVYSGDRGTKFVPGGPAEYTLRITTDAPWMLVVEE